MMFHRKRRAEVERLRREVEVESQRADALEADHRQIEQRRHLVLAVTDLLKMQRQENNFAPRIRAALEGDKP
jgi:hypothetical protein